MKKRIIKKKLNGIKILGNGEIKNKIKIQATKISKSALKKIEKVGGKVELIKIKEQLKKTQVKPKKEKVGNKDIKKNTTN